MIAGAVFLLFTIWAGSFIAIEALLTGAVARFDWLGLTAARFVPVGILAVGYCFLLRRGESLTILRLHWKRLIPCGLFAVPGYNFALFYGQQHHVAAPIASLMTTLAPLYLVVLSALFLGERVTGRKAAGFLLALSGVLVVAFAKKDAGGVAYPLLIGITALAPLSWSIHSVLTKPVGRQVSPLLWTYLAIGIGSLPMPFILPFRGGAELLSLSGTGIVLMVYLTLLSTLLAFALWTWLLQRLPASTLGFTIFLNPPLTTIYKYLLTALFPAVFAFTVVTGEWIGGALMLAGVAVATSSRRMAASR